MSTLRAGALHFVGTDRRIYKASMTWEEAWATRDVETLRQWFIENTGPRVPINYSNPLTGMQTVATQADADKLVGKYIKGYIRITASGPVDLRDFRIDATGYVHVIHPDAGKTAAIHHIEIDGKSNLDTVHGIGGPTGANLTVSHMNIHHISDGLRLMDGSTYAYCYIHDPLSWNEVGGGAPYDPDLHPHSDAMQGVVGGFEVSRMFCEMLPTRGSNIISCLILNPSAGDLANIRVTECYLSGGGYTINSPNTNTATGKVRNTVIADNLFGTQHGSPYGLWSLPDATGFRRVRNRWIKTGLPVYLQTGPMPRPVDSGA